MRGDPVNRNNLLLGLAFTLWFGVTASPLVTARQATGQPPAKPQEPVKPQPSVTVAATTQLPPGYAGTDTCILCHDAEAKSITHSRHGQAKDPRSPAATLGCESCHGLCRAAALRTCDLCPKTALCRRTLTRR